MLVKLLLTWITRTGQSTREILSMFCSMISNTQVTPKLEIQIKKAVINCRFISEIKYTFRQVEEPYR